MSFLKKLFPALGTGVGTLAPAFTTLNLISLSKQEASKPYEDSSYSIVKPPVLSEEPVLSPTPSLGSKEEKEQEASPASPSVSSDLGTGKDVSGSHASEHVDDASSESHESVKSEAVEEVEEENSSETLDLSQNKSKRKFVAGIGDFLGYVSGAFGKAKELWTSSYGVK